MEQNLYFKIRIGVLRESVALPFDMYVHLGSRYVHYLKQGDSLSLEKFSKFKDSDQFYVPMDQRATFKKFIFDSMNSGNVNPTAKARILRDTSLALVEEIYEKKDLNEALTDSKTVVTQLVNLMETNPETIDDLVQLSSHDFYTYNHSLDVGVYSMGIAKLIGYSGEDLIELGRGALFHDIGKKWVDAEIICKKGALDDVEWAQMQRHPEFGLKILSSYDVSEAIKACCFEHHESFLGNGYPQGLDGPSIHPMARIIAIADTFDALTTQRSYNKPMSPKDAITFITTKIKDKYDPEILKALDVLAQGLA